MLFMRSSICLPQIIFTQEKTHVRRCVKVPNVWQLRQINQLLQYQSRASQNEKSRPSQYSGQNSNR